MISVLKQHYRKKGSVIIVVVAIFGALLVLLASFLKSTTSRTYSTKKIGDTMLARELAYSLAILSNHYIKNIELKNTGSDLRKILSMPVNKMGDKEGQIKEEDLKKYFGDVYTRLMEGSGLRELKLNELKWKVCKTDFKYIDESVTNENDQPYSREKKGLIRIVMEFSYLLPGSKKSTKESYWFYSKINIVANIIPVLSKFSFYVEDAFNKKTINDDNVLCSYFNVVDSTEGGMLNDKSPRPWVFNNGEDLKDPIFEDYKDYVSDKRGFVYLGGGTNDKPVILGIARRFSSATQGDFGEDFHFYKDGRKGYWKVYDVWQNPLSNILEAEIGLCNDSTENFYKWQEKFGVGYDKLSRYNSIFRLYGTDDDVHPTLVFGYVDSMHGKVRAFKSNDGHNYLYYFDHEMDFLNSAHLNPNPDDWVNIVEITAFSNSYMTKTGNELTFDEYKKNYCTKVTHSRYNSDLANYLAQKKYVAEAKRRQYPLKTCQDLLKGNLIKLCEDKEDDKIFKAIPSIDGVAEYGKIYANSVDLEELDEFFKPDKLLIDCSSDSKSARIAQLIKQFKTGDDIKKCFEENGFLKNGKQLDINGWIYVDCGDDGAEVNLPELNVISQGGIILSNGNFVIKGDINCESGAHLSLIALKGDITIERSVKRVDASLVAGDGYVKLIGEPNNDDILYIKGNIIMKYIPSDSATNKIDYSKMKRGLYLEYNTDLAAIPFANKYNVEESKSELPLLMYDLKEKINMLD